MPNNKLTMSPRSANVYHLMGADENALSYGLGHLILVDPLFMLELLKKAQVIDRVRGRRYREYISNYEVHLQEQNGIGPSGRRDIVLEAGGPIGLRVIIECKVGKGKPDACQLLRYSIGCDCGMHKRENKEEIQHMWGLRHAKYIVPLTRDGLSPDVECLVSSKLSGSGIELRLLRWSYVLEVALFRLKQADINSRARIFLQDFVNFFKECYDMKSYQAEVMVKKDDPLNAQEVYLDGFMYVGDSGDIELPLYFAPEFTQKCVGKVKGVQERGIQYVSRVIRVLTTTSGQIKHDPEAIVDDQIKSDKLYPHWHRGLKAIAQRAKNEPWPDKHKNQLYFLSKPAKLPRTVLTGCDQISRGYNTTMIDLLTKSDLSQD